MYHTVDMAVTYAAEFVLFGSLVYFPIAFVVYAWQAATKKADDDRLATLQAHWDERKQALAPVESELACLNQALPLVSAAAPHRQLQETQEKLAQVEADLALIAKVMPLLHQKKAVLAAQLESEMTDTAGDDDAIAISGVPSPEVWADSEPFAVLAEPALMVGDDDAGAAASFEAAANVPLTTIVRERLTLWKRRGEKVVTTGCIPVPIPADIRRFRWRKAEVIRLADLEAIALIV